MSGYFAIEVDNFVPVWRRSMLNPTPAEQIVDAENHPYFMREIALDQFLKGLEDPQARPILLGQLLQMARPDDVFSFVSPQELSEIWSQVEGLLGRQWAFWDWLLSAWEAQGLVWR
jgi:hypothetical protein